ncbi:MAG TPA: glycosyltransferase 87 family protein [Candidatus Eisenbacteria bacterium]|nr:glycosyltransferase 87 family protein [Candidatus Eisenbacteria bacterium]
MPGERAARDLIALGTALVLAFVLMARLGSWIQALPAFQTLVAIAFACFGWALLRARGATVPRAGLLVFGVALAARLALLPVSPSLSDDVYRYVWEGRVAAAGGDPWHQGPLDPRLASLRDGEIHPRINHPELTTIYPPLAIAGFALVAALSPTVWAMKLWVVLHDLALIAILLAWVRRRGGAPLMVIAYAWNPLVVIEHAGSGHHDPTAIVWLVAAFAWAERRPVLSALALAAGVLVKLAPLVALPFLVPRWTPRARVVGVTLIALGLAWFWALTRGPQSGLDAYGRAWANNELLFAYLLRLAGDPARARAAALAALIAVLAGLVARRIEAAQATRQGLRAAFLLSPVAHPWYLAWVMVFEPLAPSAPWILLSATAFLSYGVFATPDLGTSFHLPLAWRWLEYGLPAALAVVLAIGGRARSASI